MDSKEESTSGTDKTDRIRVRIERFQSDRSIGCSSANSDKISQQFRLKKNKTHVYTVRRVIVSATTNSDFVSFRFFFQSPIAICIIRSRYHRARRLARRAFVLRRPPYRVINVCFYERSPRVVLRPDSADPRSRAVLLLLSGFFFIVLASLVGQKPVEKRAPKRIFHV